MNSHKRDAHGQLMVGSFTLKSLLQQFGSPLYVYNFQRIRETYTSLRRQLHPAIDLYYAVKANPNPSIIKQYIELGAGFDLSSVGELHLVRELGGDVKRTSFAGPGKQYSELEKAIDDSIGILSVESMSELDDINKIAADHERMVEIAFRINSIQKTRGFQIKMGGTPSPFGIDEEELEELFVCARQSKWLKIKCLHVFAGTQSLYEDAILENTANILRLTEDLSRKYDIKFEVINLGGGWGVPYHAEEKELDRGKLIAQINDMIHYYLQSRPRTHFILELGRYLVAAAGFYVTTVVRKKASRGIRFLVLDGGMNHYLAGSGNFGQVFRKNFPMLHATKLNIPERMETYNVVGPLCTPIDRMGKDVQLPETIEGDNLVFPLVGAYGYTASPLQFLNHPAPAEVAVDGNKVFKILNRIENWHLRRESKV